MTEPVVRFQEAGVRVGQGLLWRGTTFDLAAGEFIVVLGPNGAGKTTLLRMMLGLVSPSEGGVTALGGPARQARHVIGYLPQRRSVDPDLSVRGRDLVTMGLEGHRWGFPLPVRDRRQVHDRVEEAIAAVGAETYADRPLGRLSGGEQQRLWLAQALVSQPRLLLLDEPLANLDLRSQSTIASLVAGIATRGGMTVVLVAHDVNPVLPFLNRVIYVAGGRVVIGTPADIITSAVLTRLYQFPVEVVKDSRGRVLVVGAGTEDPHHQHAEGRSS
ncbi:MAG TPA: ABC transporter ATP-binding protein [Candidatus Dormibacteraeota bacterium]